MKPDEMMSLIDSELRRLNAENDWNTRVDGQRLLVAYDNSDAPWFTLPKKLWTASLEKLRSIDTADQRIDDKIDAAFSGASAGSEWDGR